MDAASAATVVALAVLERHVVVLSVLLEDHHRRTIAAGIGKRRSTQTSKLHGSLLAKALRSYSFAIVQLLHRSVIDVNYRYHDGNTILHLKVQSGRLEYVTEILEGWDGNDTLDLDASDLKHGWTPLI